MEFLKKFDLTGLQFIKLVGLLLLAILTLMFLSNFFTNSSGLGISMMSSEESVPSMMPSFYGDEDKGYGTPAVSLRNVPSPTMPPTDGGYTAGDDSEAYEVKQYNASVETRNLERDCAAVRGLKTRTDVIFENANEYERGCSYTFKVKKESVTAVLAIIEDLDPKELSETSYTIKREVTDYTSEIQILENKLASLDKTLADALASYDSISSLATQVGNVESLAKIIDSKLSMIERLTNARIETSNQLERMNRAKSEALDRLAYTYFYVNVYENKFVDGEEIKTSWKLAVQQFARDTNALVQELSIGLVALLLALLKYALYFVILLLVARFGWTFAKRVWLSGQNK